MIHRRLRSTTALALIVASLATTRAADAPPDKLQLHVSDGIEFVTDHDLSSERLSVLAAHVRDVEQRLQGELDVPPLEQPIRIYLFAKQAAFSHYVRQHVSSVGRLDTAGRHGIFLLRQGKPYVFLVAGDDLVPSLRHEAVHAVLNTSHPGLPIWMDEGLAQCYEAPDVTHHSHRAQKVLDGDLLRRDPPKAAALAKLKTMSQMGPREYAGAWHHMSRMLDEPARRAELAASLKSLRGPRDSR